MPLKTYHGVHFFDHFSAFSGLRGRISRHRDTFCATTRAQIKDFVLPVRLVPDFPYVVTQISEKLSFKEVPWQKILATKNDHPAFYLIQSLKIRKLLLIKLIGN